MGSDVVMSETQLDVLLSPRRTEQYNASLYSF